MADVVGIVQDFKQLAEGKIKKGYPNPIEPESLNPLNPGKRGGMNSEMLKTSIMNRLRAVGVQSLPSNPGIPSFEDIIGVIVEEVINHIKEHAYVTGFCAGVDTGPAPAAHDTVFINEYTSGIK